MAAWSCRTCSTSNASSVVQCIGCGAIRDAQTGHEPTVPVASVVRSPLPPPPASSAPNQPVPPPLASGALPPPPAGYVAPPATAPATSFPLPLVVTVVVLVAALGVLGVLLLAGGDDGDAAAPTSAPPTLASLSEDGPDEPPISSTSTSSVPATTVATTTTAQPEPAGVGPLAVLPSGSWIAVVASIPYGDGVGAVAEASERFAARGAPVRVLDTADHPGLTPGYWAVVLGPHPDESSARASCSQAGLSAGGACYPRLVQ